ncbi:hypothetical protein BVRB_5g105350 [Beta vulgaris subsp. vulgaris]|nr:hypothetical protein BVRB_5g105350 [Beta vulgaris subsp. vulgaris]
MALPVSTLSESKVVVDIERILPSLPKEKGWWLETLYKYKGFWFDEPLLQGTLITQKTFKAQPNTVVLATLPKSGTTWFAALLFTTMNRTRYSYSSHPLLTSSPHDCVPGIEFYASKNPSNPTMPTTFPLVAAHIPYPLLPESIKSSSCPIIYVCCNPNDVFVSLWHFANKLRPKELQPLNIEEAFDLFCKGVSPFGSYWDHVLGFWKASIEMPNKVLFVSRAEGVVRTIGGSIGDVIEVESDGIAWDKSARVKVNLDVSKPLRRIQQLKTRDGRLVVIEIKYERLPTFCYECGTIGHIERDCPMEVEEGLEEEKQWGAWLRASPRKGRMKMVEETNAFLGRSKRLVFTTPAQVGAGSRLEGSYGEGLLDVGRKETVNGAARNDGISMEGEINLEHVPSSHAFLPKHSLVPLSSLFSRFLALSSRAMISIRNSSSSPSLLVSIRCSSQYL